MAITIAASYPALNIVFCAIFALTVFTAIIILLTPSEKPLISTREKFKHVLLRVSAAVLLVAIGSTNLVGFIPKDAATIEALKTEYNLSFLRALDGSTPVLPNDGEDVMVRIQLDGSRTPVYAMLAREKDQLKLLPPGRTARPVIAA